MAKRKQKPKKVLIWRRIKGVVRLLTKESVSAVTLKNAKDGNVEIVSHKDVPSSFLVRSYKDVGEASDVAYRELKLPVMSSQELTGLRRW